jgi:hypothetical protein
MPGPANSEIIPDRKHHLRAQGGYRVRTFISVFGGFAPLRLSRTASRKIGL